MQNDLFENEDLESAKIRAAWRQLVDERLPARAEGETGWPVQHNHCFARILLDNANGQSWREVTKPPAWRHTPIPILKAAIRLGEEVLAGQADIHALNHNSLRLRGKLKL